MTRAASCGSCWRQRTRLQRPSSSCRHTPRWR
jgi:hypothetical protein